MSGISKIKGRLAVPFVVLTLAIFCSCGREGDKDGIRRAVQIQLDLYPELTLTDLYKSFFQAEFGAGHIVTDTAAAGSYLDYELTLPDSSAVLYEPIGPDASYYRVHLNCVQRGYISRMQLFDAFLRGVRPVTESEIADWIVTWHQIESVIDGMNLELANYNEDKVFIGRILSAGEYAVHHSGVFNEKYNPHYRIVRGDIFEREILPCLPKEE